MDQASSLSDSLSKTSGALASLMAMIGPDDSTTTDGLFSNLVAAEQPSREIAANDPLVASPDVPARLTSLKDLSASIQDAKDLAAVLQKILSVLQGRIGEMDAGNAKTEGAPETTNDSGILPSADEADKPETLIEALAETAAYNDGEKTLSDIVSELLMLAQLIVSALQQSMVTTGGTSASETSVPAFISVGAEWAENNDPAYALLATAILTLSDAKRDLAGTTKEVAAVVHRLFDALFCLAKAVRDEKHDGDPVFFALAGTAAPSNGDIASALVSLNIQETSVELKQAAVALKKAFFAFQESRHRAAVEKRGELVANEPADTTAAASDLAVELSPDALMEPREIPLAVSQKAAAHAVVLSVEEGDEPTLSGRSAMAQAFASASLNAPKNENGALSAAQSASEKRIGGSPWATIGADDNSSVTLRLDKSPEGLPVPLGEGVQATGNYTFASTLSAFRAANGGGTGLPGAIDQVILHLNRSVKEGQSSLTLQLQPADLGKITVKLDVKDDGQVQGTVVAEKPQTLEMLQKDSRSLERALQDAGLRAESGSLQFSLSEQNSNHARQTAGKGGRRGDSPEMPDSEGGAEIEQLEVSERYYITPNGVNIQV